MPDKLSITCLQTGVYGVNTYIIASEHDNIIIDPGGNFDDILDNLDSSKSTLILLTHSHFDHIGALNELLSALPEGAEYYAHDICAKRASDPDLNLSASLAGAEYTAVSPTKTLIDREEVTRGMITIEAIHIPGHAPGHLCFYLASEGILFSGDTIFNHSIGRSDLPGGDGYELVENCRKLLKSLPPETLIYSGHGPATTVEAEKSTNPFL